MGFAGIAAYEHYYIIAGIFPHTFKLIDTYAVSKRASLRIIDGGVCDKNIVIRATYRH